jgi:hypothetical protein
MIAMRAQPKIMPLIFEDLVLEDAGGRVILLELKAGTARTPLLAELISENSQAAILTGSIAGTLATAMAEWIRQEGSYRDVLDALAPKERGTLSAAAVLQARQNAAARHQFLEEFPALTSADVADAAGSKATNRASLANRWREEGKVFARIPIRRRRPAAADHCERASAAGRRPSE